MRAAIATVLALIAHSATAQPLVQAGVGDAMLAIGSMVEVLEDREGRLTLGEVRNQVGFRRSAQVVPNMQVSPSVFWLRFRLRNNGPTDALFLHIPQPDIGRIEVNVLRPGSEEVQTFLGGQQVPVSRWQNPDVDTWVRIPLRTHEEAAVYLRVSSDKLLRLPIEVGNGSALARKRTFRDGFGGAYVGIILVMLLYNLFVCFSTRDGSYIPYVIYISLVGLTQADFLGINKMYLWPEHTWLGHHAAFLLTLATAVAANEFMHRFLQTERYVPRMRRASWAFYTFFGAGLCLKAAGLHIASYHLLQATTACLAFYQLVVSLVAWRRGSRGARFFLIAWTVFLAGVMLYVLKDMDVLPYNAITKQTMTVGSAVEVVLLSFGLADKINVLRREKEASQAAALEASRENERIIREQNALLERKVMERTRELQESNETLKRTQAQLVNAEKMASLGQLTAGIAHEINNPVNFITSNIQPLRRNLADIMAVMRAYRDLEPGDMAEVLAAIRAKEQELGLDDSIAELDDIIGSIAEGSNRTAEIVRGLRNFSRLDEDDLKEADLNEGIRSTLALLAPQYRRQVRISLHPGPLPAVECFPGKVNQVVMNVLTNAVQAALLTTDPEGPTVAVSTAVENGHAVIAITDNGPGMTEEVKARIFDPFFTTKPVGEGTGLGLAIVYGIVQEHRGRIEVDTTPGQGTCFRIQLPLRHAGEDRKRA